MVGITLIALILAYAIHYHYRKTFKELLCVIDELKKDNEELIEHIETYEEWDDHVFQEWLETKVKNNGGRY